MRISASSSTIRMSCAMDDFAQRHRSGIVVDGLGRPRLDREDEPDPGTLSTSIFEHQLSPVILHDLFDDGETEASSFGAGRHIGFGQPLTVLAWQAFAVVFDDDRYLTRSLAD